MMKALDSHCHLFHDQHATSAEEVLDRARNAGVTQFVDVGCWLDQQRRERTLENAMQRYPEVVCALGVHPHDAAGADQETVATIDRVLKGAPQHVVAVGETGLDYHYGFSPAHSQQERFRQFIRLARDRGLPLIIHTREAEEHTLRIMSEEGASEVGGVVHCFTGTMDFALRMLDLGFHIGFTGIVTFKGESAEPLRQVARRVPLDRILVETDTPYLAPVPMRGKPNEPAYLVHTITQMARLRDLSSEQMAELTAHNTRRLFRIPQLPSG